MLPIKNARHSHASRNLCGDLSNSYSRRSDFCAAGAAGRSSRQSSFDILAWLPYEFAYLSRKKINSGYWCVISAYSSSSQHAFPPHPNRVEARPRPLDPVTESMQAGHCRGKGSRHLARYHCWSQNCQRLVSARGAPADRACAGARAVVPSGLTDGAGCGGRGDFAASGDGQFCASWLVSLPAAGTVESRTLFWYDSSGWTVSAAESVRRLRPEASYGPLAASDASKLRRIHLPTTELCLSAGPREQQDGQSQRHYHTTKSQALFHIRLRRAHRLL